MQDNRGDLRTRLSLRHAVNRQRCRLRHARSTLTVRHPIVQISTRTNRWFHGSIELSRSRSTELLPNLLLLERVISNTSSVSCHPTTPHSLNISPQTARIADLRLS
jgi:hypothetical protein